MPCGAPAAAAAAAAAAVAICSVADAAASRFNALARFALAASVVLRLLSSIASNPRNRLSMPAPSPRLRDGTGAEFDVCSSPALVKARLDSLCVCPVPIRVLLSVAFVFALASSLALGLRACRIIIGRIIESSCDPTCAACIFVWDSLADVVPAAKSKFSCDCTRLSICTAKGSLPIPVPPSSSPATRSLRRTAMLSRSARRDLIAVSSPTSA